MSHLLDTNVCIDFLLGRHANLEHRLVEHAGDLRASAITEAELRVGSRSSSDPTRDRQRLDTFFSRVAVMPFDREAAERYGTLVRQVGVQRLSFDRLIAAHALSLGDILVTSDKRGFADVPGLQVEDWTR